MRTKLSAFLAIGFWAVSVGLCDEPQRSVESARTASDSQSRLHATHKLIQQATAELDLLRQEYQADQVDHAKRLDAESRKALEALISQIEMLEQAASELKERNSEQIQFQFRMLELTGKAAEEWTARFNVDFGPNRPLNITDAEADEWLRKLNTSGGMNVLAEPVLITTLGRPANMLCGGEFPILIPAEGKTTRTEWREFGTRCQVVALRTDVSNQLRVDFQASVSERDFNHAVQIAGNTVPGLTTRRVNTEAMVRYGETLVVSQMTGKPQRANDGAENVIQEKTITVFMVTPSRLTSPKPKSAVGN